MDWQIPAALATALGVGLIIGLERGWHERNLSEGSRIAGIRTFGLIGLLGAVCALIGQHAGGAVLAVGLAGLTALLAVAVWQVSTRYQEFGITTEIAALLTYLLGAAIVLGYREAAVSAAVVVALILGLKPVLHDWLRRIAERELLAGLQLLVISLVVLPLLPDRGFGPEAALNPYRLWWMVVLIAGLSFLGYVATRISGPGKGVLLTGLFGGLVSSTAATVTLSRHARAAPAPASLAAAVVLASVAMLPRIAVEVVVTRPALLAPLLPALLAAAVTGLAAVWWLWRAEAPGAPPGDELANPLELAAAFQFAVFLALVLLLTAWLRQHYGDAGLFAIASLSGLIQVDAITLSIGSQSDLTLTPPVAVAAIWLAAVSNTVTKGAIVATLAGGRTARLVIVAFLAMTAAGTAGLAVLLL